jgi:hypothetical protein
MKTVRTVSTPQRIRFGVGLVVVLAAAFFAHTFATLSHLRETVRLLRDETAPNIVAADAMRAELAELDALAAVELTGSPAQRHAAHDQLETRRHELVGRLLGATENITFGDEERPLLLTLNEDLGRFFETMGDARARLETGNPSAALTAYHSAHELMEADLTVAAELDRVNRAHLDQAYAAEKSLEEGGRVTLVLFGLTVVLVLVGFQIFLARRTRRVFNVPLLVSTALVLATIQFGGGALEEAQHSLRVAKENAFDSVHLLWQARAVAYGARGDESRFLLDPNSGAAFQQAFDARVAQLTDADGLLARELSSASFPGEKISAGAAQRDFLAFLQVDRRLRALDADQHHAEALDLAVGTPPDGALAAFARFDQALGATLDIVQRAFVAQTLEGEDTLRRLAIAVPLVGMLVIAASFFAVQARLREYAT